MTDWVTTSSSISTYLFPEGCPNGLIVEGTVVHQVDRVTFRHSLERRIKGIVCMSAPFKRGSSCNFAHGIF